MAETTTYVSEVRSGLTAFPNEGWLDRALRLVAGALILVLGWHGLSEGLAGVALRILGWYPVITGLFGWSPIYALLGCSTRSDRA